MNKFWIIILSIFIIPGISNAQTNDSIPVIDYSDPSNYEIGGVKVSGNNFSDENAIISLSGFKIGNTVRIPGAATAKAIKALMRLRLFTDVQIYITKTIGDVIFLEIAVQERPRLTRHSYKGAKKSRHDDLNDIVNRHIPKGSIVTDNAKANVKKGLEDYYIGKGYLDAAINVTEHKDTLRVNSVRLVFDVDKKSKVKIKDITFTGNTIKDRKLMKKMDDTKPKRKIFSGSKFINSDYEVDKKNIISYYNTLGFRDARILNDSTWRDEKGLIHVHMDLFEGNQYYFRNITWKGNSIYDTETLERVLGIEKGDIYNEELLQTRLTFSIDGRDISSLYQDNGYLFFQVDPIEVAIEGDSIDLEMRMREGPQATIDKVVIKGNDRTHEHVIRRELRTKPGAKFSRSDIIRSQREIINLGYFNPESLDIQTPINPQQGTVDIEYTVEEKPSDQLELSAGWGGQARVIGTLGVTFNNFSVRNIFKPEAWHPLPQGDGQRLSLRAQTNGRFYQAYNASFTEPWLGGKKPNSFTLAGSYTRLTRGDRASEFYRKLAISRIAVSFGTRLKFPDDNFVSTTTLSYQNIDLFKYISIALTDGNFLTEGQLKSFSVQQTIARNSINDPIYPKTGSRISLSVALTPPYSLFNNKDYTEVDAEGSLIIDPEERFKWLEYHKWRFNAEWYTTLIGNLVVKADAKIGMLGFYKKDIGTAPFERFELGGDGLSNQGSTFTGNDIISSRGYDRSDFGASLDGGAALFNKYTLELRYAITTNPSSTIYILGFAQAANAWNTFREFNPFDAKRSAGAGLRVFLPMFGTLGFDWGVGFDKPDLQATNAKWSEFATFNIILGFEPE